MGPLSLGLLCLWGEESVVVTDTEEIASTELQSGETHLLGDIYFSKHLKGCIFFFFLSNTIMSHFSVYIVCSARPPRPLTLMFRIHLNLLFFPSYVTLNTFLRLADETFSSVWFPLCVSNMSRGSHAHPLLWKWFPFQWWRPCDKVTQAIVQVKSQTSELRLAADVTPSSVAFHASNNTIQPQEISRAKPLICEFKPNKVKKVEVCFTLKLLLPELICIHASLLWLWCRENWTKLGEKKKKWNKKEENMVRMMKELLGLKWVSPPLLAAPAFDWYPQIHVEFRFALLLFGGRVIADNQLCLLFLTGSHLSAIPSSRVIHWGLQPLDLSFYLCEHAEWVLMCLSCDNSSGICPFTANHS